MAQLLEDGGTRRVGEGKVVQLNTARYALINHPIPEMLGIEAGEELETFVNFEEGVVIHRKTDGDEQA
jgi:hypothetical protein